MFKTIINSLDSLNHSTYFAGIMILISNIASKYISIELSETQQAYLRNTIGRQFLIFTIIWVSLRDIFKSLVLTAVFVVLAEYLFNENSSMCIIPKEMKRMKHIIDTNGDNVISEDEIARALKILDKANRDFKHREKLEQVNYFSQ